MNRIFHLFWLLILTSGLLFGQTTDTATTQGSQADAPPHIVTKFWYPWLSTSWPPAYFSFGIMDSDDAGLWILGSNPGVHYSLFRVNLPDFTTQIISLPEGDPPQELKCTSDAVYLIRETHGHTGSGDAIPHQIMRYDIKTSEWTMHDLPDYFGCKLYSLEDSLYLFLNLKVGSNETAMARYDWDQDQTIILSSTRRRPAQNQFDDRTAVLYAQMFMGPGHKPCVTTQEGTFYIHETSGAWPEVFDGSFDQESLTASGCTLVLNQRGEATFLDPNAAAPEYWMAPALPMVRKRPIPGSPIVKEIAPWAAQTIWDPVPHEAMWYTKVGFNHDHLFILEKPKIKGGTYDLLVYEKGRGRSAHHVPLEFHLDDHARSQLSEKPTDAPVTWAAGQIEHPDTTVYPDSNVQMFSTKIGLVLQPANVGFWFLPYSDIDAYLNAHSTSPSASSTTGSSLTPTPPRPL
jgi:hypothetical protein